MARGIASRQLSILIAAAIGLLGFACSSSPALAASTHPYLEEWSVGPNCNPREVVSDAAGDMYVACESMGVNGLVGSIRKFSSTGAPIPFTANAPYINGNEINEDPGNGDETHQFGLDITLDVDKSSARPGFIYVSSNAAFDSSSEGIDIFAPSGEYVTSIRGEYLTGQAGGVGVDQNGYIYGVWDGCCGRAHMSIYDPANFHEIRRMVPYKGPFGVEPFNGPCCTRIRPDSSGAIWVGWGVTVFDGGQQAFGKWEANQFGTNLNAGEKDPSTVLAKPSPFLREAFPEVECPETQQLNESIYPCALNGQSFDVDLNNNDVYALFGNKITPYSQGVTGDPVHQDGPTFGEGKINQGQGIDIDNSGTVSVTAEPNKVVRFSRGLTLPTVTTKDEAVSDIGHETATVRGLIAPEGGGQIESCQVKWGASKTYNKPPVPCEQALPYPDGSTEEVTAKLPGLTVGNTYHFRFQAGNAHGVNIGGDRLFEAKAVLDLESKPATEVDDHNATLQGQLDADGLPTEYFYEYGPSASYGLDTLDSEGKGIAVSGASGQVEQAPFKLGHLQSGHEYHYRLVAKNSLGTTRGTDLAFRTASPPDISGLGAENITDTSADILATINPNGFDTTYALEYGTTPAYGASLPASGNDLGSENAPQKIELHLSDLTPGATIHYRIVATNKWGTSTTDDTTFNFRPSDCPNAHVREITGSSYLPDCRAYELVSPAFAGAVQLMPGEGLHTFEETFGGSEFAQYPQNFGYASGPSRFMYIGALGSINGIDAPNSLLDIYLATRTNRGWVTTLPGLKGSETAFSYGQACSERQDLCVDHIGALYVQNEKGEQEQVPKSASPYLYKSDGTRLGRLPTNVGVIKEGTKFRGDEELSGDFSHFIFSTLTPFTPDGPSEAPGAIYDNDISAKTVTIISRTDKGEPLPLEPAVQSDPTHMNGIAAVSSDGSRVLMAGTTQPACDINGPPFKCPYILGFPARLSMRVDDSLTYEVSREHEVNYVGMTRNGSKVFFTTAEALLPSDKDTSADLYMWEEEGNQLKLVSQEGSLGNDDDCSASWVEKCGVQALTPERAVGSSNFDYVAHVPGTDDVLASQSGDIYFYSPQDLVQGEVGGDGQRNLYLFRNGHLQLVTTLEPGTEIERSTISADGGHAAFMTKSSLTAYYSEGHPEVYTYDADLNAMRCASCNPAGTPPMAGEHVVNVAEAGPTMADDGRTFFATKESLVPQDTDGIRDIYEYVGGHAQLISSGTGNRDSTGGLETIGAFFGNVQDGLEAVSRDGDDVYFSTFDTLAPEDQNGSFLKMYDARVGGGFDFSPDLGPCAAADECHGAGTNPPAAAQLATAATLGASGNLPARKPAKKDKKRGKKKHHRHHGRHGSRRNG